jgi:hypothetical protein
MLALGALLDQWSVTRAAEQLGLSQPTLSEALARLRRHFGDELLIRDGRVLNMGISDDQRWKVHLPVGLPAEGREILLPRAAGMFASFGPLGARRFLVTMTARAPVSVVVTRSWTPSSCLRRGISLRVRLSRQRARR